MSKPSSSQCLLTVDAPCGTERAGGSTGHPGGTQAGWQEISAQNSRNSMAVKGRDLSSQLVLAGLGQGSGGFRVALQVQGTHLSPGLLHRNSHGETAPELSGEGHRAQYPACSGHSRRHHGVGLHALGLEPSLLQLLSWRTRA